MISLALGRDTPRLAIGTVLSDREQKATLDFDAQAG